MLKTVKLNTVFINSENKDGKAYVNKNGQPFKMVNINFEGKDGEVRASMYASDERDGWKVAQAIEWKDKLINKEDVSILVTLEKSGDFWNFDLPSKVSLMEGRLTAVEEFLKDTVGYGLPASVREEPKEEVKEKPQSEAKTEDVDPSDIPF